ncbi:hypothetical protein [Sedimenticola selenatireducens]|uniref:hypothetical protein n=1 Tax=Sedimenticola selenatireducens TaxID=191960 RepID=UPI00048A6F5F|nr:hypothetical protein [Sedimenticola selenatireducens]
MRKIGMAGLIFLLTAGLVGCSGHPGAGNWESTGPVDAPFSRLMVHYEGRAELIDAKTGADSHHCFWGGKSAREIQLDCTTPQDTETRIRFVLQVGEDGIARLLKDDVDIGEFKRLAE